MEYAASKYGRGTISHMDNRHSLGNNLGTNKNAAVGWRTNVDTLDITTPARGPTNELMLESVNTPGICMYADIGNMEVMVDVMGSFVHWFISSIVMNTPVHQ